MNIEGTNMLAISWLSDYDKYTNAQTIFRKNVLTNPTLLTLNNLGVYYIQYGMVTKSGKVRGAKRLGLKYLLKASMIQYDWKNLINIATVCNEIGNEDLAYQYYLKAYNLHNDEKLLYNIGACLLKNGNIPDAINVFESLCQKDSCIIEQIIFSGGLHPMLMLAYCKIEVGELDECKRIIREYRRMYYEDNRFDVFVLRFLCGMYEEALSECEALLKEWNLSVELLAMLKVCLRECSSYADIVRADGILVKDLLIKNNTIGRQSFEKVIKEYRFVPPLIDLYYYIY